MTTDREEFESWYADYSAQEKRDGFEPNPIEDEWVWWQDKQANDHVYPEPFATF
jgi:hypothetical protein